METEKKHSLITLFFGTLAISACTFGGGFVIAGFMKKKFVDELHWLSEEEMLDYVAIAQSCPGAIAVNTAILTGLRVRGFIGMLVAVLAMILPPMCILGIISVFYNSFASSRPIALLLRGMQAGVAAVILDVVCSLGRKTLKTRSPLNLAVMVLAFAAVRFLKINVIWIILAVLLLGIGRAVWDALRERRRSA